MLLHKNEVPLLVRELNSLKNLKRKHTALIFDDIDWSNVSRENKLHLLDKERSSAI